MSASLHSIRMRVAAAIGRDAWRLVAGASFHTHYRLTRRRPTDASQQVHLK
jgi:hypothetical protein